MNKQITVGGITVFLLLIMARLSAAVEISVTTFNDVIANDGVCSLREAVLASNESIGLINPVAGECPTGQGSDVILVPEGTYNLSIEGQNEDQATQGDLDILDHLVIRGTGDALPIINAHGIDRIFHIQRGDLTDAPKVEIRNLSLTQGVIPNMGFGGAVFANAGTLRVISSQFVLNQTAGGGAIFSNVPLEVRDSSFSLNSATLVGAAIVSSQNLTIVNSRFFENEAQAVGAVLSNGNLIIDRGVFERNIAISGNAGALYVASARDQAARATVRNSTFSNNRAGPDENVGLGGAIFAASAELTVENSTINNNEADKGGGMYVDGTVRLSNVTFAANRTEDLLGDGGGIYGSTDSLELLNVSLVKNAARNGGGIYNEAGSIVRLRNTLVFDNTAKASGPDCFGRLVSQDHNLVANAVMCRLEIEGSHRPGEHDLIGGVRDVPVFIKVTDLALADNGGFTKTVALAVNSSAEDAGSCTAADGARLEADQRGFPKGAQVVNGQINLAENCDIGAYEAQGESLQQEIIAALNAQNQGQCGNGAQEGAEACDDGNQVDDDACNNLCQANAANNQQPVCGNQMLEGAEACDDGNVADNDGCNSLCQIEANNGNVPQPPVNGGAGPACGDSHLDNGETCDDGNLLNGDGCSDACQTENVANNQANNNNNNANGGSSGGGCALDPSSKAKPLMSGMFIVFTALWMKRRMA